MTASITVVIGIIGYNLSVRMHNMMVFSVLHAEMERFLDRIPIGRIVNRFSRDVDEVDKNVYSNFSYLLRINATVLILFATICYTIGWEVIILILIWTGYAWYCSNQFMDIRREFKRVQSVAKSPMINCFTDMLKGLPLLRNTGSQMYEWMRVKFVKQIEIITNLSIYDEILVNWFDVRLGITQNIVVVGGCLALLIFYYKNLTSSSFGLFLLCTFQMGNSLSEAIKSRTQMAMSMVSVERCSFLNKLTPE